MGRDGGRHERHEVEGERLARVLGGAQVAQVNRVEGAAVEADPHARSRASIATRLCASSPSRRRLSATSPAPVTAETGTTSRPSASRGALERGERVPGRGGVLLGRGDELRPLDELRQVAPHLVAHQLEVGRGIASVRAGGVDHVQQHARALDVAQELEAQPRAGVGALDDAGDVGGHEALLVLLDDAQHRRERRERVVGDLGARRREPRQQRRLAGVRQAQEADIGDQPEVEAQPVLLAGARPLRPRAGRGSCSKGRSGCRGRRGRPWPRPAGRRPSAPRPAAGPSWPRALRCRAARSPRRAMPSLPVRLPGPPWVPRSARNSVW